MYLYICICLEVFGAGIVVAPAQATLYESNYLDLALRGSVAAIHKSP
jgi:hypothetical protein